MPVEIELADLLDVVEHLRQFGGHAVDLRLGQLQARKARDVDPPVPGRAGRQSIDCSTDLAAWRGHGSSGIGPGTLMSGTRSCRPERQLNSVRATVLVPEMGPIHSQRPVGGAARAQRSTPGRRQAPPPSTLDADHGRPRSAARTIRREAASTDREREQ